MPQSLDRRPPQRDAALEGEREKEDPAAPDGRAQTHSRPQSLALEWDTSVSSCCCPPPSEAHRAPAPQPPPAPRPPGHQHEPWEKTEDPALSQTPETHTHTYALAHFQSTEPDLCTQHSYTLTHFPACRVCIQSEYIHVLQINTHTHTHTHTHVIHMGTQTSTQINK